MLARKRERRLDSWTCCVGLAWLWCLPPAGPTWTLDLGTGPHCSRVRRWGLDEIMDGTHRSRTNSLLPHQCDGPSALSRVLRTFPRSLPHASPPPSHFAPAALHLAPSSTLVLVSLSAALRSRRHRRLPLRPQSRWPGHGLVACLRGVLCALACPSRAGLASRRPHAAGTAISLFRPLLSFPPSRQATPCPGEGDPDSRRGPALRRAVS